MNDNEPPKIDEWNGPDRGTNQNAGCAICIIAALSTVLVFGLAWKILKGLM